MAETSSNNEEVEVQIITHHDVAFVSSQVTHVNDKEMTDKERQRKKNRFGGFSSKLFLFYVSLVGLLCTQFFRSTGKEMEIYLSQPLFYEEMNLTKFERSFNGIINNNKISMVLMDNDFSNAAPNTSATDRNTRSVAGVNSYDTAHSKTIRKWGCHRNETPLIFVHIGKAGGGKVRARFAAAAQNYGRGYLWHAPQNDEHYYPIQELANNATGRSIGTATRSYNASFCNSKNRNYRIPGSKLWPKTFEGSLPCLATTPLGLALGCPQPTTKKELCLGCNNFAKEHCHTVYMGHNQMGNELHWLPSKYLERWWKSTEWSNHLTFQWKSLIPEDGRWCSDANIFPTIATNHTQTQAGRPTTNEQYKELFECSVQITNTVDQQFNQYWQEHVAKGHSLTRDFSPIYASLPLHRVTILREPFQWLVSKFFWHERYVSGFNCDDVERASNSSLTEPGWAYVDCMHYINYLCGNDCSIRVERGQMSLDELEAQAENNLRHSFSVVGLLEQTDAFFEMVTQRISYVNMSLNPHVKGGRHGTRKTPMHRQCSKLYDDGEFQERFKQQLPILGVADRLYKVAVEVNRFQQEELRQCIMSSNA